MESCTFINNRNDKPVEEWISFSDKAAGYALFNAMTGEKGLAKTRKDEGGKTEIWISCSRMNR